MHEDDDTQAFRDAMRGIVVRKPSDRVEPARKPLSPRPVQFETDELAALRESLEMVPEDALIASGEVLNYRMPGVQDSVFRRLRRGGYRIGDELDLHGLNAEKARLAVHVFLAQCQDRDVRCVRIIHGKGLRSSNDGPVLKRSIDGWLRRRKDVLAFHSARPHDGGAGAVYVLLRKPGNAARP
ncbi:Smr/MutS family protein [Algiphilus sp. W345]|uniref:Smr/MutS family protein n=1 Tax=Banduia mediterranea TaxID=3075609 RepID=A0ABU2WNM1_9GAMM|nr:Smr/MutS family protein [Algiphilus sp. W345]MDT0499150.1 Smr/MutS family protein [Algiphilus sp. W345]